MKFRHILHRRSFCGLSSFPGTQVITSSFPRIVLEIVFAFLEHGLQTDNALRFEVFEMPYV